MSFVNCSKCGRGYESDTTVGGCPYCREHQELIRAAFQPNAKSNNVSASGGSGALIILALVLWFGWSYIMLVWEKIKYFFDLISELNNIIMMPFNFIGNYFEVDGSDIFKIGAWIFLIIYFGVHFYKKLKK